MRSVICTMHGIYPAYEIMPRSERVNAFTAGHSFLWSNYSFFFPSIPFCSFAI